jgi:hypothetical protein
MKPTRIAFLVAGLALFMAANSNPAWANLAANTQIINQASLSYNDGTGVKTASAAVTVTIALVPSAPNILPGSAQSTSYNGAATTLTDSFTITAGANGPDTYTLDAGVTASSNTSGAAANEAVATVSLGASVTTSGSTTTNIVVPADGNLPGEMPGVNGIQIGDTVVINGEARTVTNIFDNASGTSTIVLNAALTAAPGTGVLVAEQQVVTVLVTAGTIATTGTDVTVSANLIVTSTTDALATATSGAILNTYTSGVATLAKYVRNVSVESGSGVAYVYNSINYYPSGVTAKPNDTLEYLLVASNSGSGAVSASVITDILPTEFITLKDNAYAAGKEVTYVDDIGAVTTLSKAVDADTARYTAATNTLTVNVGTGATNALGGSIPGINKSVLVLYQATVNP